MEVLKHSMHRSMIGVLAAGMLVVAAVFHLTGWAGVDAAGWIGALVRVGLVLGVWWLAEPQLRRLPKWLLPMVMVGLVLLLLFRNRPVHLLVAVVLVLLLAALRPRGKPGSRPPRR